MTKPTICHLGAWGRNWGDRAIQYALQNAVGREEYEWENVDIQGSWWTSGDVPYVDDEAGLLVIGGGGLLWDKPELHSASGWQWQIKPSQIEHVDIPIIVHAIGDTRFPYGDDQTGHRPEFKESLTILAEKAVSFSVRDALTQQILADMDIKTTLCPDPALFIGEPREKAPDGPPILGVCLAWDKAPWRWPGRYQGAATFVEYMDALSEALAGFVKEGWQLRPFCHIPDDSPTIKLCEAITIDARTDPDNIACAALPLGTDGLFHAAVLAQDYAECTVVVSMRKHGIIIPAGLGVPVVGLGDLAEVRSICEQLGVECITSEKASPLTITRAIERQVDLLDFPSSLVYRRLRAAHDQHITKIREALA